MKQTGQKKTFWQKLGFGSTGKSAFSQSFTPSSYRTGDFWFFSSDGTETHFSYADLNSCLKAYTDCPPITAIVNRKAQAYINGKTWVLNAKGKEAQSEEAKKIKALLAKPNAVQSWKQFEAQGYIYQQVMGYLVILPIKPVGFGNIDATALWNIPPYMLEIKEKKDINFQSSKTPKDFIESIYLVWNGVRTPLDLDAIYIMKDFTPSFDSLILPSSRIKSLSMPINNIIGTYESRNVLINRRGPMNIFSSAKTDESGSIALSTNEIKDMQEQFKKYGLRKTQWQQIVTSAAIQVQSVGFATKDLMLFEEIEDDIMRICDSYSYPYQLISSAKGTTFANVNDAKKLLYQDGIIPEAESMYEQWNQFFGLTGTGIRIDKDYSHIPALQEDKVQQATARKILNESKKIEFEQGLITLDQWLEALGEDPLPNGQGQVRATDPKNTNVPLAVTIGVGGVQSLISVLTATGMSEEAKKNTVEIVFGIASSDAARMVVQSEQQPQQGTQQQDSTEQPINNAEEIQTP